MQDILNLFEDKKHMRHQIFQNIPNNEKLIDITEHIS